MIYKPKFKLFGFFFKILLFSLSELGSLSKNGSKSCLFSDIFLVKLL